jgi:hypothetical protein
MSPTVCWIAAVFVLIDALVTVASIGKPRRPITRREAAATVLLEGLLIAALVAGTGVVTW